MIILIAIKWLFLLTGLFFCIIAILGLYRMPEIYNKQHSLGLLDTVGIFLIMASLAIDSGFHLVSLKPLFLAVIVICMSPPLCYAFLQFATRKKGDFTYNNDKKLGK